MREGHPFKVTTPDADPDFCPICSRPIDRSSVHVADGWVDFDCEACGEVRLDLEKHRENRGFAEHLETALSQYDRASSPSLGGPSLEQSQKANAKEAESFRERMKDFVVARRATIAGGGRLAVAGAFEPTGAGRTEVGGLAGITTFDLIVEGGRPPNVV